MVMNVMESTTPGRGISRCTTQMFNMGEDLLSDSTSKRIHMAREGGI